jgi:hypothetical protein
MTALSEVSKRGPRLTPEQKAEKKRNQTQARVGLASNVVGLGAGGLAVRQALKEPALRKKVGQEVVTPTYKVTPKMKWLAGGALALQAANIGGDVVANRVLARNAAPATPGKVKKDESITDAYISKADKTSGQGSAYGDLSDDEFERRIRDKSRGRRREIAVQGTASGAVLGGLTGSLAGSPHASGKRIAGRAGIGAGIGGATMAGLIHHAHEKAIKRAKTDPVQRYALEQRLQAGDRLKARAMEAKARRDAVGKAYRRYDPEADRQRRLGLYAGAGGGGALILGSQAARHFSTDVGTHEGKKVRGIKVRPKAGKKALLLTGATLGAGAFGAGAYKRGLSERNNPWN